MDERSWFSRPFFYPFYPCDPRLKFLTVCVPKGMPAGAVIRRFTLYSFSNPDQI